MKALSVKQPWANLIADGRKTIETRTWTTPYRGPLLIVSSKRPNIPPTGSAVAIADLVDCRRMTRRDRNAACCEIYPNAVSWVLENVRKIKPFPVTGALGIFEYPIDQIRLEVVASQQPR
ncbi:MAG: ASCH domain-containing protein [Gammaproteobacteria bacterium]|nr:ASCH domain-containing protein [Gammaproteobacteria bacterium]MYF37932.1 ASCH domain-containing protein [Gammaproteobacteria bacterium]